ncbi:hypothetical protein C0V70_03305 [Bacteriovorax stolpii]|uniref:Uncharacterized protein n=1 Tax=Bacteriovorax stolpii TaxID=960 RepID=A0A2K9NNQ7_BACTC|nr:hypothetical protein [Bacteriovorax stolpii]AUN97150.1 hypothetical protein C0V70_03305 [Bacteriovorax stolpii]TDP53436.1 hypothetical protein C8D79_2080 [Bacteriovorax stolpii]
MKKQSMMFFTFSALLTVSAFAPKIFWDQQKTTGRAPSSLEEDRLEKLELEKKEATKKEELKKNEITVQCLKDDKSSKLDEEIKKLMADKQAIIKELEELKKAKKEDTKEDAPKKDEAKKEVVKTDSNQDVLMIMSQLTSLMISQQQQQQMMMQQMFSMMAQQKPQYQSPYDSFSPVSEYVSPYAYMYDSFNNFGYMPYAPFSEMGGYPGIGIGYQPSRSFTPYQQIGGMDRAPSQEKMERYYFQPQFQEQAQEQQQQPMPHDGFNFSVNSSNDFNRVRFE